MSPDALLDPPAAEDSPEHHESGIEELKSLADVEATIRDQEVEALMAQAYGHLAVADLTNARECYLAADRHLGSEDTSPRRALVLVSLGEIARTEGRADEASTWFDRALTIAPRHIGALRARAALAREAGESAVAAATLQRLVGSLETDTERIDTLSTIASESLAAAGDAIRQALLIKPRDPLLLERLQAVHEASGQWDAAVGAAVERAETIGDRSDRARALVEAARLCGERTGNTPRAVALYEAAIEDNPEAPGAFQAIEQELLRVRDFSGVCAAYRRQLDRLGDTDGRDEPCRLLRQLAEVEWAQLNNVPGALDALDRLVGLAPADPLARIAQAELLATAGQYRLAISALEVAAELLPSRVPTYRKLYELFAACRDQDRVYAASAALVALGEADIDEQLGYAQYAPSAVLAVQRRLDAALWQELAPPGHQREIDRVAAALQSAAIDVWLEEHPDRAQERMNERLRQHPSKTTVSAVRCAVWVADFLGVPEPVVYAQADNDRASVATLPTHEHALLLGRHVLAGRSIPELSFILGRHLSYARPGWRILMFYSSLGELEPLMRACLSLACPDWPGLANLDPRARQLKELLGPRLDGPRLAEIAEAVGVLLGQKATFDLVSWARSVETIACRAALLACGDATVASAALAVSGAPAGGVSAHDRALQLLPFAVSERYSALRRLLGVAVV